MLESRIISISVKRNWQEIYEMIWRPEDFPKWASGLSKAGLARDGDTWKAQGPEGPIRIRFTPHNAFGIMDHYVDTGSGPEIYVPLRIIQNGNGADVQLTVFRQPGMSDAKFAEDAEWVKNDLLALKALVTDNSDNNMPDTGTRKRHAMNDLPSLHRQRGYLLEIPILFAIVVMVLAVVIPKLSPFGQKIALAIGAVPILFALFYMIVTPGWTPDSSGRLKWPWNWVVFLLVAVAIIAGVVMVFLS